MPLPRPSPPKQSTKESPKETANSNLRPSDVFRFEPQGDITIEELGYLISVFWTLDVNYNIFSDLDGKLQRHFRVK